MNVGHGERTPGQPAGLTIQLAAGVGTGPTELAAFDAALCDAGVANYNLVVLSSVIPPASTLVRLDRATPGGTWGDRLYVVMARQIATRPGEQAWAGIGWVQDDTGKGLFVEHEGHSRQQLDADLDATLTAMLPARAQPFGPIQTFTQGATCQSDPVCALTVAVYRPAGWHEG